jgi:hypothetical protein
MANPRIGQTATLNKKQVVWSGQNYGWQSPATHKKLADQGKFRVGTQALDRLASSANRALEKHAPGVKKHFENVAADQQRSAQRQDKQIRQTAGNRVANAVQQDATGKVLDKASKATNVDRRIVGATAAAAQAAIGKAALKGGAKPNTQNVKISSSGQVTTSPARSVGAAAKADVAGRTVPATKNLPKSARPTGTVKAGNAAPSKELTAARRSQVRPNTAQTARQASGPAHPVSDPKQLAPGNSPTRQAPSNFHTKEQLKKKAQTQYADMAERGHQGRIRRQTPGQDTSYYLPNRGRVSPTDRGRAAELARTHDQRLAQALEGKRGPDRVAARNAFNKAERRAVKDIRRDAIKKAQQYQTSQESKLKKGTTVSSRQAMAADVAKRPRTQPIRNTSTKTTGTQRVAANPESGTSQRGVRARVIQTKDGEVVVRSKPAPVEGSTKELKLKPQSGASNLRNNPRSRTNFDDQKPGNRVAGRSINPATGRPYQPSGNDPTKVSTKKPSASTRQAKGGNPQENFPSRPGRAKMEGEFRNPAGGKPIKTAQTELREAQLEQRPGLTVGKPKAPTGIKGTSSQDQRQRRNGRNIGRLGQSGRSNVDTPSTRSRAAANKARASEAKPAATPTAPTRSAQRTAALRERSKAASASTRSTRGMTPKQIQALQNKYNKELPTSPTTHFSGEVRLQGSKYSMDPQAKNLVDGSVSRSVGTTKGQGRSAEAATASKKTMEAVKARKATRKAADRVVSGKAASTIRNGKKQVKGSGQKRVIKPSQVTKNRRAQVNGLRIRARR